MTVDHMSITPEFGWK